MKANLRRRILASIMAGVICMGNIPMQSFAQEEVTVQAEDTAAEAAAQAAEEAARQAAQQAAEEATRQEQERAEAERLAAEQPAQKVDNEAAEPVVSNAEDVASERQEDSIQEGTANLNAVSEENGSPAEEAADDENAQETIDESNDTITISEPQVQSFAMSVATLALPEDAEVEDMEEEGMEEDAVKMADAEDESDNLAEFIRSIILEAPQSADGTYQVEEGKAYHFKLTFQESSTGAQFKADGMSMPLPSELTLVDVDNKGFFNTFSIKSRDEGIDFEISGNTYRLENGFLSVQFNQDDPNYAHLAASANASFEVEFWGTIAQDAEELDWGNDWVTKVEVEQPSAQLEINKVMSYNSKTGFVECIVHVKAIGEQTNVQVTDSVLGRALSYREDAGAYLGEFWNHSDVTGEWSTAEEKEGVCETQGNGFVYEFDYLKDETISILYTLAVDPGNLMNTNGDPITGGEGITDNELKLPTPKRCVEP